jgi:hypothetical protein
MLIDKEITIKIAPREDGGIRVWSDEVPGLVLSHSNQELVLADIGMALLAILRHRATGPEVTNRER